MRAAERGPSALRVQLPNAGQAPPAPVAWPLDFTSDQADFPTPLFQRFEPASPSEGFGRPPPPLSACPRPASGPAPAAHWAWAPAPRPRHREPCGAA